MPRHHGWLLLQLWDLTAGKQLHEFKLHEGPIRAMEFHPTEFLLATGSQDRTCKLWDLEKFELVGNMVDSTAIQAVAFSSDGAHVIAATQDHVKVGGEERAGARRGRLVSRQRCIRWITDVGSTGLCPGNNERSLRLLPASTQAIEFRDGSLRNFPSLQDADN